MTQVQVDEGGQDVQGWQVGKACVCQVEALQVVQVGQGHLREVANWVASQLEGAQVRQIQNGNIIQFYVCQIERDEERGEEEMGRKVWPQKVVVPEAELLQFRQR